MNKVFISYSHKDEDWKNRLQTQLEVLEMEGMLSIWSDRRIELGDNWYIEIEKALNEADIAILLVSANFLTSRFIKEEEMAFFLKRRKEEDIRIIPLIIKPCPWNKVEWLTTIQGAIRSNVPLSLLSEAEQDSYLSDLVSKVYDLLKKEKQRPIIHNVGVKSDDFSEEEVHIFGTNSVISPDESRTSSERNSSLTMTFSPNKHIYQLELRNIALPRFDAGIVSNFEKWNLQFDFTGSLINTDDYTGERLEFMAYAKREGLWCRRSNGSGPARVRIPQNFQCGESVFRIKRAPLPDLYYALLELPQSKVYPLTDKTVLLGRNDNKVKENITLDLLDKPNTLTLSNGINSALSINFLGVSDEHVEVRQERGMLYVKQKSLSAPFYILDKDCQIKQTIHRRDISEGGTVDDLVGKLTVGDYLLVGFYLLKFSYLDSSLQKNLFASSKLQLVVGSDRGDRKENQDSYLLIPPDGEGVFLKQEKESSISLPLWPRHSCRLAIADGMGGHENGRQIAEELIQKLQKLPPQSSTHQLRDEIYDLHKYLWGKYSKSKLKSPGTTLVLADVDSNGGALIANVGDCRAYLWRGGSWEQLSYDQNLNEYDWRDNCLDDVSDYQPNHRKHQIAQAMGYGSYGLLTNKYGYRALQHSPKLRLDLADELKEDRQHPDIFKIQLQKGDALLLASDGVWSAEKGIEPLGIPYPSEIASKSGLHNYLNKIRCNGGVDNMTAVMLWIKS